MEYFVQYGRRIAIGIMSVILTASLAYKICMPVQAAQLGTIADLAAHVYENTNTESNIVANVILGYNFPILAEETDEGGNAWYLIETDTGVQGYIPAQSVIKITTDAQNENTQGRDAQTQEPVTDEENENNLPDSVKKQILTMQAVNIRENPSINEEIIGKIPLGMTLDFIDTITNTTGEVWYEVSYDDIHGFVKQSAVKEIEVPVQGTDGTQSYTAGINADNIDIDRLIEIARQYQSESLARESAIDADALDEIQVSDRIINYDNIMTEENTGETKKGMSIFRPDMVIILSFAGIMLCFAVICHTYKKMMKLFRQTTCRKG